MKISFDETAILLFFFIVGLLMLRNGCEESKPLKENILSTDTLFISDTVIVKDTVKIKSFSTKIDTVFIDSVKNIVYGFDSTVIKNDDSLKLSLKHTLPGDLWQINFLLNRKTVKETTKIENTIYLPQKERFLDRFYFGPAIGIGINPEGKLQTGFNLGIYYKIF